MAGSYEKVKLMSAEWIHVRPAARPLGQGCFAFAQVSSQHSLANQAAERLTNYGIDVIRTRDLSGDNRVL
jgi:hypothetical protein